jgi:glycerol-3-phosphate dehydrogenase (NAD(P)+)
MANFKVLGSGGWGIALALGAYKKGHNVTLWSPFEDEVKELLSTRESKLLKGVKIPEDIEITTKLTSNEKWDFIIIAVPSFAVRETAARLKTVDCDIVINVAKGFEKATKSRLSEVIAEELPDKKVVVLSGPSHAEEVARGVPTSVVSASEDVNAALSVQEALISNNFRIYTNSDVVGVEVGGALKNVIAVASGIENGLNLGDNTRAALMTRGLAEIARLGVKLGADTKTFMGLSGLGDLIVTCMSEHSRNNRFGNLIGNGVSVAEALKTVGTVEGYYAVEIVNGMAKEYGISMPITEECYNILYKGDEPSLALKRLMSRPGRTEEENNWM